MAEEDASLWIVEPRLGVVGCARYAVAVGDSAGNRGGAGTDSGLANSLGCLRAGPVQYSGGSDFPQ